MTNRTFTSGPRDSKIVIVGEALGYQEKAQGEPFVGASGMELSRMLTEAGLDLRHCFCTNVLHDTAPFKSFYKVKEAKSLNIERVCGRYPHPKVAAGREAIRKEIAELNPNVIIVLGDIALWSLCDLQGIGKWRGSILETQFGKVVPTYNPAGVLKNWPWRWICVQDFRRVETQSHFPEVRKPDWKFLIRPTFDQACEALESIRGKLVVSDIETRGNQISCVGFATDKLNAFCIPFMTSETEDGNYWIPEHELHLTLLMKDVLQSEGTETIFQNGLFDVQHFAKQWGYIPNVPHDTMVMFHVCYPGLRKALDFQASVICDYYRFWKDEGKKWTIRDGEDTHWVYNCEDCVYTFEIFEANLKSISTYKLEDQYTEQMELFIPVLRMMLKGVRADLYYKRKLSGQLLAAQTARMEWFEITLGHELNPNSPQQVADVFYYELGMKEIRDRKTKARTTDDDALELLMYRQPLLTPLVRTLQELRSIGVFKSTFVDAKVDADDYLRCSFNLTGAKTFRFSSSKNAFGGGCNFENIPKGTEDD